MRDFSQFKGGMTWPKWTNGKYACVSSHGQIGRTDRQTTCDRNTALCTKVHRAVKIEIIGIKTYNKKAMLSQGNRAMPL